jgi:Capsule polysaccharide biosynthesis protein
MTGDAASVIFHVPDRYHALLAKPDRPMIFHVVRDLVTARGGTVLLAHRDPVRDGQGRWVEDGHLHIVNNGAAVGPGYLNAATAYLADYWHLDPQGVQGNSSIGGRLFDPAAIDPDAATVHLDALRMRFVLPRRSRYRQAAKRTDLTPGGIAVFLQGPAPYKRGQAHLPPEAMLRAVCDGAGERAVWVKPHPLKPEEGTALIARLQGQGLPLVQVDANVHDLLAAACATVSVNSAAAIEGLLHGTPAILFGRSDFPAVVETVTRAEDFARALHRALSRPRDYAAFLYWYFHDQCLWLGDPDLPDRVWPIFAQAGFPPARLGLRD